MYTKTVYYARPRSLRMSDEEIAQLAKLVRDAEDAAVESMRDERALESYEAAWRELYEEEISR